MTGQCYFGFRTTIAGEKKSWVQDVLKSERKLGPSCKSEFCAKSNTRHCKKLSDSDRCQIFRHFWRLEWKEKKKFVKSLIDSVPAKRRRTSHKGDLSRKGDSKCYHLNLNSEKVQVCRVTFLNTLGIKEAMVRCWLAKETKPKSPKVPLKSLNVVEYIETLPKIDPKCQFCANLGSNIKYIDLDVKNQFQLYNVYQRDMADKGISPASRKTFAKILSRKNLRIFKPKHQRDVCDLVKQHNNINFGFEGQKCDGFYYEVSNLNEHWPS